MEGQARRQNLWKAEARLELRRRTQVARIARKQSKNINKLVFRSRRGANVEADRSNEILRRPEERKKRQNNNNGKDRKKTNKRTTKSLWREDGLGVGAAWTAAEWRCSWLVGLNYFLGVARFLVTSRRTQRASPALYIRYLRRMPNCVRTSIGSIARGQPAAKKSDTKRRRWVKPKKKLRRTRARRLEPARSKVGGSARRTRFRAHP